MPIIRQLIRIINDIAANCNYLSDVNEILYSSQLITMVTIIFQNSYATPLIRQIIRVINPIRGQNEKMSDFDEIWYVV